MSDNSILNDVINYSSRNTVRFHMPGHGGKAVGAFFDPVLPYDVTELKDTDNLYNPSPDGGIAASFRKAKELFGTAGTVFSVGGATLALQASIAAVLRRSGTKKIVCDRRCHVSVINTLALSDAEPLWFFSDDIRSVQRLCEEKPAAVIVTSPDYYGEIYDLEALRAAVPDSIPLIADNSHGSHLAFYDGGRLHPYRQGADLVIDSLHKTLPSMTGTALLHHNHKFTEQELLAAMRLFASTSPSYILMSSICACLNYIDANRGKFNDLSEIIAEAKNRLRKMYYTINDRGDPFRICIHDMYAPQLYTHLARDNVVCEFADAQNVIIIPSLLSIRDDFDTLLESCKKFIPSPPAPEKKLTHIPRQALSPHKAVFSASERIKVIKAAGRIASGPVTPYPPGIPVIMPGEIIDEEVINNLTDNNIKYLDVIL
jgi:arginine decarboxylase